MYFFLNEDSAKVTQKKIPIPDNAKKVFKAMKNIYEPYLDKLAGGKVLKSLGSDKKYNLKGTDSSKDNGEDIKNNDYVTVDVAKVRLHRQNKYSPNSVEYQLYGGKLAHDILDKGIKASRRTNKVDPVSPPKPTSNASLKPKNVSSDEIKVPNGKITVNSVSEGVIKEDIEYFYEEFLTEYNVYYVLNEWYNDRTGKQSWGSLINPSMYQKALQEFMKYGRFINFPTNYVYQWMGIIMKNTSILMANTELAGHTTHYPIEEVYDFLSYHYFDDNDIDVFDYHDKEVICRLPISYALSLCRKAGVDLYGDDTPQGIVEEWEEQCGNLLNTYRNSWSLELRDEEIYGRIDMFDLLDIEGLYDWMEMPDGSEAWSDYGLDPLMEIIGEYDESLPPEKVIVLVNRALDVYHYRGDLASIFITGGSKTLSNISESVKMNGKKKVIMTERQLMLLKKDG